VTGIEVVIGNCLPVYLVAWSRLIRVFVKQLAIKVIIMYFVLCFYFTGYFNN